MTIQEFRKLSTYERVKFLRQCNGVHATLEELFSCESCNFLFEDLPQDTKQRVMELRSNNNDN